jgi:hypothetical protein
MIAPGVLFITPTDYKQSVKIGDQIYKVIQIEKHDFCMFVDVVQGGPRFFFPRVGATLCVSPTIFESFSFVCKA